MAGRISTTSIAVQYTPLTANQPVQNGKYPSTKLPSVSTVLKMVAVGSLALFNPAAACTQEGQNSRSGVMMASPNYDLCAQVDVPKGCMFLNSVPYTSNDTNLQGMEFCQTEFACQSKDGTGTVIRTIQPLSTITCKKEKENIEIIFKVVTMAAAVLFFVQCIIRQDANTQRDSKSGVADAELVPY